MLRKERLTHEGFKRSLLLHLNGRKVVRTHTLEAVNSAGVSLPFGRLRIAWSKLMHDGSSLAGGRLSHVGMLCKICTARRAMVDQFGRRLSPTVRVRLLRLIGEQVGASVVLKVIARSATDRARIQSIVIARRICEGADHGQEQLSAFGGEELVRREALQVVDEVLLDVLLVRVTQRDQSRADHRTAHLTRVHFAGEFVRGQLVVRNDFRLKLDRRQTERERTSNDRTHHRQRTLTSRRARRADLRHRLERKKGKISSGKRAKRAVPGLVTRTKPVEAMV